MNRPAMILCLSLAAGCLPAHAQRVDPSWASVDSRPTPTWWSDAKFGIFIHWGVYSVPSFAPKGEYAEWYWERLRAPGNPASAKDREIRPETRYPKRPSLNMTSNKSLERTRER